MQSGADDKFDPLPLHGDSGWNIQSPDSTLASSTSHTQGWTMSILIVACYRLILENRKEGVLAHLARYVPHVVEAQGRGLPSCLLSPYLSRLKVRSLGYLYRKRCPYFDRMMTALQLPLRFDLTPFFSSRKLQSGHPPPNLLT